jgi:hypothetical protein
MKASHLLSMRTEIGRLFVAFCKRQTGDFPLSVFQEQLSVYFPEISIHEVYRWGGAEEDLLYFTDKPEFNPQPYWRVSSTNNQFLVPKPQTSEKFNDSNNPRGFDIPNEYTSPSQLHSLWPALLINRQQRWEIADFGSLNPVTIPPIRSNPKEEPASISTRRSDSLRKESPARPAITIEPVEYPKTRQKENDSNVKEIAQHGFSEVLECSGKHHDAEVPHTAVSSATPGFANVGKPGDKEAEPSPSIPTFHPQSHINKKDLSGTNTPILPPKAIEPESAASSKSHIPVVLTNTTSEVSYESSSSLADAEMKNKVDQAFVSFYTEQHQIPTAEVLAIYLRKKLSVEDIKISDLRCMKKVNGTIEFEKVAKSNDSMFWMLSISDRLNLLFPKPRQNGGFEIINGTNNPLMKGTPPFNLMYMKDFKSAVLNVSGTMFTSMSICELTFNNTET